MNQLQLIMVITLSALVTLTVLLAVVYIIQRRRISQLMVGHYGTAEVTAPISQNLPPAMPVIQTTDQPAGQPQFVQPTAQPAESLSQPTVEPKQEVEKPAARESAKDESPVLQIHEHHDHQADNKPDASQSQTATQPSQPAQPDKPLSGAVEDPFYK